MVISHSYVNVYQRVSNMGVCHDLTPMADTNIFLGQQMCEEFLWEIHRWGWVKHMSTPWCSHLFESWISMPASYLGVTTRVWSAANWKAHQPASLPTNRPTNWSICHKLQHYKLYNKLSILMTITLTMGGHDFRHLSILFWLVGSASFT